jgi:hypothetical protein
MQLYSLLSLFTDTSVQRIVLCDLKDCGAENIFEGTIDDLFSEYENLEVCSIDPLDETGILTINIDTTA